MKEQGWRLLGQKWVLKAFSGREDGVTRGANIGDYNRYGGLDDIGKIVLGEDKFNYAKPSNYLFSGMELGKK